MTEKERHFFDAVKSSNRNKIMQFINDGIDVNVKDCDGWTALMIATDNDDVKTIELLAKKGADIDLKNDDGETALMIAAYDNAKRAGEFLLINGADAAITDKYGRTAYEIAHEFHVYRGKNFFLHDSVEKIKNKALFDRFSDFFLAKNYGEKVFEKELEVKFKHIDDFENQIYRFINYSNENGALKFIKTVEPGVFLIIPSKKEIKIFLDGIFLNKPSGTKIKRCDLHDCFKDRYKTDLCEINLGPFLTKYDCVIVDKDGDYVILPSEKEIKSFFDGFFLNKASGTKIKRSDLRMCFKDRYKVDLSEIYLGPFFSNYDNFIISKYDYVIVDKSRDYVILPSEKEVKRFLDSFFLNRTGGTKIKRCDLHGCFRNRYKVDFRIINTVLRTANYDNLILNKYDYVIVDKNGDYVILPSEKEIERFLDSFFLNKSSGTKIKRCDLMDSFRNKYNVDLCEINLGLRVTNYDDLITNKYNCVIIDKDGDYIIFPSKGEMEFFLSEYENGVKGVISLDAIYDSFCSRYNIDLNSSILDNYINQFRKITKVFFMDLVEKGNLNDVYIFFFDALRETLGMSKSYDLFMRLFTDFLHELGSCQNELSYSIEKIQDGIYVRIPLGVESEFIKGIFCSKPPRKFFYNDLQCVVNSLGMVNKVLEKKGLELRALRGCPEKYILTYNTRQCTEAFCSKLGEYLRLKFLENDVRCACGVSEVIDYFKNNYDVEIDGLLLDLALAKANAALKDIKIIESFDKKTLRADLVNSNLVYNEMICPFCKLAFDGQKSLKLHVLDRHTTCDVDCSILTRTSQQGFYCHHCRRDNLRLYENGVILGAVLGHVYGDCTRDSFVSYSINKRRNNQSNGIWGGTMYSNDASTLGNSGQMFRDRGQFGSFPSEDNYGNGDTNF